MPVRQFSCSYTAADEWESLQRARVLFSTVQRQRHLARRSLRACLAPDPGYPLARGRLFFVLVQYAYPYTYFREYFRKYFRTLLQQCRQGYDTVQPYIATYVYLKGTFVLSYFRTFVCNSQLLLATHIASYIPSYYIATYSNRCRTKITYCTCTVHVVYYYEVRKYVRFVASYVASQYFESTYYIQLSL